MDKFKVLFNTHIRTLSAETIGWFAVLLLHSATLPSILGLLFGITDRLPSIDLIAFLWSGLILLYIKALISKDTLNIITIGVGFMIQAGLLGFIVFK